MPGLRAGNLSVCFDDATIHAPGMEALKCLRVTVPELALRPRQAIQGTVNLQHSSISTLHDDPGSWPAELLLDGLRYDILDPQLPAARRLTWLARDSRGHLPRPYEQLAASYRTLGSDGDARTVLLAKQRARRAALPWCARTWGYVQEITVGYGYRPARAALWLAALLGVGTVVFAADQPPAFSGTAAPAFNPLAYTLNLLLPVMNFGQAHAYDPRGIEQWLAYALTIAGWTLATTVTAGIIRVLRRD
jgi:hypothetical protein